MDYDRADVASVFEADVGPGFSCVGGFVNAIAERNISADTGFAGAGVNYVGIGISNGNGADRGDGLLVKERIPGDATVGCFPDAAADCAEIIGVRLAGNACNRYGAAAPERADESPLHAAVGFRIDLLRLNERAHAQKIRTQAKIKRETGWRNDFTQTSGDKQKDVAWYHRRSR